MEKQLTLSFASGRGDIKHNKRQKNGNPRTWGMRDRRDWNVTWHERDLDAVIRSKIEPALGAYNEKMIAQRRYNRTMTYDTWLLKHTGNGKNKPYTEYVVQLGNKLSCCTYKHMVDSEGYPLDKKGRIMPWQTRKTPEPLLENGRLFESEMSRFIKPVYYDIVVEFERENPGMVVIGAYVHADEKGGTHMHLDVVCFSRTKNGIGVGLSKTGCVAEMLDARGIKYGKTRTDNALKTWTKRMREMCTRVAAKHGIRVVDGRCAGRKHETIDTYIEQENARVDYLDKMYVDLQEKEERLARKEAGLNVRSQRLLKQESELAQKRASLETLEDGLYDMKQELRQRESDIKTREHELQRREEMLSTREQGVALDKKTIAATREANHRENMALIEREKTLRKQETAVEKRELAVVEKEEKLATYEYIIGRIKAEHPEWLAEYKLDVSSNKRGMRRW